MDQQPQKETAAPAEAPAQTSTSAQTQTPAQAQAPASPSRRKTASSPPKKRRRKRPSPVPVSMWLLPQVRLPFSTLQGFLRWFVTGINFWALGAVAVCAVAGFMLVGKLSQPRQMGVEQALSGGEGTSGLTYTVEQTGEKEVTVTGTWDAEKDQQEPGPELAAALCAALSPEEIYGHSDHLYRAIASRFFAGEDFDLTIRLVRALSKEDEEEPEPIFSVTRPAGSQDWPQPDCAAAFGKKWRDLYDQYWLFGQGRKEEMGPPQSDPIFEEGDLPDEPSQSEEDEAPPLPDLDGDDGPDGEENGEDGETGEDNEDPDSQPPKDNSSSDGGSSSDGEDSDGDDEPPPPEGWLDKLLKYAARYRGLSWKEAWALFWGKED